MSKSILGKSGVNKCLGLWGWKHAFNRYIRWFMESSDMYYKLGNRSTHVRWWFTERIIVGERCICFV